MWALYSKYMRIIFSANGLGCIISTYISCKINGHFDTNYVIHMTKVIVPWNQTTLAGYLGEDFYIFFAAVAFNVIAGVIFLLFVSICIYHSAFYQMFEHSINKWNQNINGDQNDEQFIFDLISFHIEVKAWVEEKNNERSWDFSLFSFSDGFYIQSIFIVHYFWFNWSAAQSCCLHPLLTLIW